MMLVRDWTQGTAAIVMRGVQFKQWPIVRLERRRRAIDVKLSRSMSNKDSFSRHINVVVNDSSRDFFGHIWMAISKYWLVHDTADYISSEQKQIFGRVVPDFDDPVITSCHNCYTIVLRQATRGTHRIEETLLKRGSGIRRRCSEAGIRLWTQISPTEIREVFDSPVSRVLVKA